MGKIPLHISYSNPLKIKSKYHIYSCFKSLNSENDWGEIAWSLRDEFHLPILHAIITDCLMFVSPCIIIRFKSFNQQDATVSQVYYFTLCAAHHVSGVSPPIIRSIQLH